MPVAADHRTVPGTGELLLREQLLDHFSNSRAAYVGNAVNTAITLLVCASVAPPALLATLGIVLCVLLLWRHMVGVKFRNLANNSELAAIARQVDAYAAGLSVYWAVTIASLFTMSDPGRQMVLAMLAGGMMSGGIASFRTRERSALIYLIGILPGPLLAFLSLGSFAGYAAVGLLASYSAFLFQQVRNVARRFDAGINRSHELAASNETIAVLLHDFDQQGSEWRFETDSGGRIVDPSAKFCELAERPAEALTGQALIALFDEGETRDALARQFGGGRAFRNQIVSLTIGGNPRWWMINARPGVNGGWHGVMSDITAQRQAEQQVSYMAQFDGLTDLPNRYQFNERLYHELNRGPKQLAMMYLDLDNFKSVNDTLGHPVGDRLLREVARRLEKCVSTDEIVARLGGDEFAVIVPAHRLDETERMADRIVASLAEPFSLGDHDVVIGTSIGIALAPDDAHEPDILMRKADLALYTAKVAGRNRTMLFAPEMDVAAQERRILEMDLRGALAKGEFKLHYQPVIDLPSRRTSGYEALIRWDHPKRGAILPGEFIKIAEETGMILQIGEWVIRTAIADMAGWQDEQTVSINLSPVQMRSPSLVSTLANALAQNQVDPARVCLEITETVLMHDTEANVETLHTLRRLGVQIALDDFGTGYSSLNYLRSFPFSKIKIDRCFVTDIDQREDCQAIVRSVIDLATSLGMGTTAEGVESEEQLASLIAQGCNEVQGYLFGGAQSLDYYTDLRKPAGPPKHFVASSDAVEVPVCDRNAA